jgi:hypothetical protein
MKITTRQLHSIIKEEVSRVLAEGPARMGSKAPRADPELDLATAMEDFEAAAKAFAASGVTDALVHQAYKAYEASDNDGVPMGTPLTKIFWDTPVSDGYDELYGGSVGKGSIVAAARRALKALDDGTVSYERPRREAVRLADMWSTMLFDLSRVGPERLQAAVDREAVRSEKEKAKYAKWAASARGFGRG